ncbi:Ribulosamine/erythrulosamine 3-kinase potentially involved in protein deglycation [hydrothermal vent metagenome]|uniref:Ribulosamine/erythrulosamine 3-kinase potentially involved in protein deglycation n=1 Tax=hydrothermal vent metagenome TaxID=652676 RepID=A0A3B0YD12_9ZZZZ
MTLWQQISEQISLHTTSDFRTTSHISVAGGSINQAFKISNGQRHYFVKLNDLKHGDMFEIEALSLQEMAASKTVHVPQPICTGQYTGQNTALAWLVMEYLELSNRALSSASARQLGQQLSTMHKIYAPLFGWHVNNTIGSTPQSNQQHAHWVDFWREQRLLPQLRLAERNGYGKALSGVSDKLVSDFHVLFTHHQPTPSMLHGDLWGGNAASLTRGTPVIFDPAFYYGDRETDIAMTHLFGGFSADFYAAYNEAWPLDEGFKVRKTFYNLYHILNHLNLFGSGYLGQAISMAEQVLAEI